MKAQPPTEQERIALERIKSTNGLVVIAVLAVSCLYPIVQILPDRLSSVSVGLAVVIVLGAVGLVVYRACFLRCPRCSGWVAIPKCPACGLKLSQE